MISMNRCKINMRDDDLMKEENICEVSGNLNKGPTENIYVFF